MLKLPRASAEEFLDEPRHDMAELEQSLGHVAAVNRWLGGVSALAPYIKPLLRPAQRLRILDVATGSADIPVHIVRWARKRNCAVDLVATDLHPQMLQLARRRCAAYPEITLQQTNASQLPYPRHSFDVSLLSLALHHFDDAMQLRVLREMARVTRALVLVNDLERSWLNFVGARLLGFTFWRANRLTRHDGPLSVLRSFTRAELRQIGRAAGLGSRVERRFFQRIVLVGDASAANTAAVNTDRK